MGIRAILRPDVALDFGWVYVYHVCTGHRILQDTLDGEDDGYAILGWLFLGGCMYTTCVLGTGYFRRLYMEKMMDMLS